LIENQECKKCTLVVTIQVSLIPNYLIFSASFLTLSFFYFLSSSFSFFFAYFKSVLDCKFIHNGRCTIVRTPVFDQLLNFDQEVSDHLVFFSMIKSNGRFWLDFYMFFPLFLYSGTIEWYQSKEKLWVHWS